MIKVLSLDKFLGKKIVLIGIRKKLFLGKKENVR